MGWWKWHSQLCGRNEKLVPDTSIEMKILADNWWHCDCLVQVLGPMLPCPDSFRIETSALWYHVAFHIVHRILSIDSNRKKPFIVILSFVNLAEKTSFERKKNRLTAFELTVELFAVPANRVEANGEFSTGRLQASIDHGAPS